MGDWSKLITVNFVGGYCGDFICSLVYNSYYGSQVDFFNSVTKAKFSPNMACFKSVAFEGEGLRNFDMITNLYYNNDFYSTFVNDINRVSDNIDFFDYAYSHVAKIYRTCYDPDKQTFINNVLDYCRNVIPSDLKDFTIITHHSTDTRIPEFKFSNIFLGSHNIAIVSSDSKFDRYFRLLGYHKFYKRLYTDRTLKQAFQQMRALESEFLISCERSVLNDMGEIKIYVDKFLFSNDFTYVKQMEDIFSSIMGKQIVFNKDAIKTYRENNRKIYSRYLNIPEDFDHVDPINVSKINAFMDDVEGKNV